MFCNHLPYACLFFLTKVLDLETRRIDDYGHLLAVGFWDLGCIGKRVHSKRLIIMIWKYQLRKHIEDMIEPEMALASQRPKAAVWERQNTQCEPVSFKARKFQWGAGHKILSQDIQCYPRA